MVSDFNFLLYSNQELYYMDLNPLAHIKIREDRAYRLITISQSKAVYKYYIYIFRWAKLIFSQSRSSATHDTQ